jgi:FAD:protein FMN transferase
MSTLTEARVVFPCFGGRAAVVASGGAGTDRRVRTVRRQLEGWHDAFTRFDNLSELSLLNSAPGARVRVSATMVRFVAAALDAARRTGGLVDPTLVGELEAAGYRVTLGEPIELGTALALAPPREPAAPNPHARWREVSVDPVAGAILRPLGVRLDSGGIAKGLFADLAAEMLAGCSAFAVDCAGDLRLGGSDGQARAVRVDDPFGRGVVHEFELTEGGVATSGIGRRSWIDADGRPAHHLLDPSTGRPAFTGVVQATAIAPTAVEAEARAKAALLSGPDGAREWLARGGGVLVLDDGSHHVVE